VVVVAELAGRQRLEPHVVLDVRVVTMTEFGLA